MTRRALPLLLLLGAITGCSLNIGTRRQDSTLSVHGLVNGFVSADALRPYDGTIFSVGVLSDTRSGELVSLDFWPVFGLGIGAAGVRTRVLPVEAGVGVLFYDPKPPPRRSAPLEGHEAEGEPAEPTDGPTELEPSPESAPAPETEPAPQPESAPEPEGETSSENRRPSGA